MKRLVPLFVLLAAGCAPPLHAENPVVLVEPPDIEVEQLVSPQALADDEQPAEQLEEISDLAEEVPVELTRPAGILGVLQGCAPGDPLCGAGGLGLSGVGQGGGGTGQGLGLGRMGTIGHGGGTGSGQGYGSGSGRLGAASRPTPPQVRMGATSVTGRLPPEVIQRIVRQSFTRFRLCYEHGLRSDPNLAGRVVVRFTIAPDGSVGQVQGEGTLGDAAVVGCIHRGFQTLSFPAPEGGGHVSVSYPLTFAPGS